MGSCWTTFTCPAWYVTVIELAGAAAGGCTVTVYSVPQADLDAASGELTNTATVTGHCTVTSCTPTSPPSTVHVPVSPPTLAFTGVEDGPLLLRGGIALLLLGGLMMVFGVRRRRS
jgi:hypothetical protein